MLLFFASCTSTKDIAYFQDAQNGNETTITPRPITLRPGDKLSIVVNTRNQELNNMFNLAYVSRYIGTNTTSNASQGLSCYTIDEDGNISFPVIGDIHIAGMTREQVADELKTRLITNNLVKDAVVTVEFANLKYSVLGEVKNPNSYSIDRDNITLLDAISKAGDLNIQGQRTNVRVIRQDVDGKQKIYAVNLCSIDDLLNSPAYYIKQNDVIYVEPNKMRARQSTVNGNNVRSSSFWISLASLLTSVINLITR